MKVRKCLMCPSTSDNVVFYLNHPAICSTQCWRKWSELSYQEEMALLGYPDCSPIIEAIQGERHGRLPGL